MRIFGRTDSDGREEPRGDANSVSVACLHAIVITERVCVCVENLLHTLDWIRIRMFEGENSDVQTFVVWCGQRNASFHSLLRKSHRPHFGVVCFAYIHGPVRLLVGNWWGERLESQERVRGRWGEWDWRFLIIRGEKILLGIHFFGAFFAHCATVWSRHLSSAIRLLDLFLCVLRSNLFACLSGLVTRFCLRTFTATFYWLCVNRVCSAKYVYISPLDWLIGSFLLEKIWNRDGLPCHQAGEFYRRIRCRRLINKRLPAWLLLLFRSLHPRRKM